MSESKSTAYTSGTSAVPSSFSATMNIEPLHPHFLSVAGIVRGGYRVQDVVLKKAPHQPANSLLLLVEAKLGPEQNPHSNAIRNIPVTFEEDSPQKDYRQVEIEDGSQHVSVTLERIV